MPELKACQWPCGAVVALSAFLALRAAAQVSEASTLDERLSVHTLVREDIFAGMLANNLERLARAERNIDTLLVQRPAAKPDLLALQGATVFYRSVLALESGEKLQFERLYRRAAGLFADAMRLAPRAIGPAAVSGGVCLILEQRIPEPYRTQCLTAAYDAYRVLWREQAAFFDKLPTHHKGEILAGLAQTAQRTGHTGEMRDHLAKIISDLPGTSYHSAALRWTERPEIAPRTSLVCQSCHEPGRLAARRAELEKPPRHENQ